MKSLPVMICHICFIIPYNPQFGKISMKTTIRPPYQYNS